MRWLFTEIVVPRWVLIMCAVEILLLLAALLGLAIAYY